MNEDENAARKTQRWVRDNTRKMGKTIKESAAKKIVQERLEKHADQASSLYNKSRASDYVNPAVEKTRGALITAKHRIKDFDEHVGISSGADNVSNAINQKVGLPVKGFLVDKGIADKSERLRYLTETAYGDIRTVIKPYFDPEDTRELLTNTRRELITITACIRQVSDGEAAEWMSSFGKMLSAKVAGFSGTATLFGIVSTFGTAGTGAAISTLSGAAAANATIAALGFGGGMAAGALVLSGFGLVVGFVTYKLLRSSNARAFDTLSDEDMRVVETCGLLAATLTEKLKEYPIQLTAHDYRELTAILAELHQYLIENAETICSRLDSKNSRKYRQKILRDFEPAILNKFNRYAKLAPVSIEGVIGGVFYALITQTALDGSPEQQMVLEALERSNHLLNGASETKLSDYLSGLSPEQLQGVANNVKGIYFELLYVETYNAVNADTYAELYSSTTHQGSDVMIKSTQTEEVLMEFQIKATSSSSYIREHQNRYSDIKVVAPEEVALKMDGIIHGGETNEELIEHTTSVLKAVTSNTIADRVMESAEYTALINGGLEALNVLRGTATLPEAGKRAIRSTTSAAAATGITAYLFAL